MGYDQNLWLHGPEHFLTEVGTMNLFVVFNRKGTYEIVTPPLDGMILPGVTRDSVLALARDHESGKQRLPGLDKEVVVAERPVTMREIQEASRTGQLVEMFGAGEFVCNWLSWRWSVNIGLFLGTAALISAVDRIGYLGEDILIPTGNDGMGPIGHIIWKEIVGRQTGVIPSEWSVMVA